RRSSDLSNHSVALPRAEAVTALRTVPRSGSAGDDGIADPEESGMLMNSSLYADHLVVGLVANRIHGTSLRSGSQCENRVKSTACHCWICLEIGCRAGGMIYGVTSEVTSFVHREQ